jgi:L-aminopeptidase/D-esterase-like protein
MKDQFLIGHYSDRENITGCTVILCPPKTTASCNISGSAPGSRETALLSPHRKIDAIQALLLTGGSAYGLNAAAGVMQYLEERGQGYKTNFGVVPIVPAAVIYDLNIGNSNIRPVPENAYLACKEANVDFGIQGSVGAGTGATVGKWSGIKNGMKGGIGIASLKTGKTFVTAVTVVNSVGDVINQNGEIIAGARNDNSQFIAEDDFEKRLFYTHQKFPGNTVLCAILTNARLTKLEANILSRRAQTGLVRAIVPASTSYDGDIVFSLANRQQDCNPELVYEIGAEAVRRSIIAGVQNAESLGGFPSINDTYR